MARWMKWSCALVTVATLAACGDETNVGTGGGGAGGGGAGGGGAGGTGGGGAVTCLDPSVYASLFTIDDPSLCAVAMYSYADDLSFLVPSWGTHGGPLYVMPGANGSVDIVRFTPPAGAMGALTSAATTVDAMIPAGAFVGAQAIDTPFLGWTAISWTGAFPDTVGEIIAIKGSAVDQRFALNGAFGLAATAKDSTHGRLFSTALSALEDPTASVNGLYAADLCGTSIVPNGDPSCVAPSMVAAWGDASGPVTADRAGNVFAVLTSFDGTQEARGFEAAEAGAGAPPSMGNVLFTIPGFGSSLAAVAPGAVDPGLLVFQPSDPTTFEALDVIAQRYRIQGGAVVKDGEPSALLTIATKNTSVYVMVDASDRLWAVIPGMTSASFVVIAKKP